MRRAWRSLTSRVQRAWRWFASQGPIIAAFVLLSCGSVGSAVFQVADELNEARHDRSQDEAVLEQQRVNERLRTQVDRFQFEQECRFQVTQPLAEIQAEKQDAFDAGLVALVEDDDAELARQVERIERARQREQDALRARAEAVDTCNRRAEALFG